MNEKQMYFYAIGYYEGRALGYSNTEINGDAERHYYNIGYEKGVFDYCQEIEEAR